MLLCAKRRRSSTRLGLTGCTVDFPGLGLPPKYSEEKAIVGAMRKMDAIGQMRARTGKMGKWMMGNEAEYDRLGTRKRRVDIKLH